MKQLKITSAFKHNEDMPAKYTCQGEDINPEMTIEEIPKDAKSLAIICDDPDAPMGTWDHWVEFNIHVTDYIKENCSRIGVQGRNSWQRLGYRGPCPPSGTHRYFFKIYALDCVLDLKEGADKKEVLAAMQNHILAKGEIIGLYEKC